MNSHLLLKILCHVCLSDSVWIEFNLFFFNFINYQSLYICLLRRRSDYERILILKINYVFHKTSS